MNRGRKIAHFATGGGALDTAQGLPAATPALGYTPGPETNAAGSWGAATESGGIPGDTSANLAQVGAPPAWAGGGGDYVPPAPPLPAAAPNVYAPQNNYPPPSTFYGGEPILNAPGASTGFGPGSLTNPNQNAGEGGGGENVPGLLSAKKGGAIPDKVESFAGGGRSGHGAYHQAVLPEGYLSDIGAPERNPSYDPSLDVAGQAFNRAIRGGGEKPTPQAGPSQSPVPDSDENGGSDKPNGKSNMPSMQSAGQQASKLAQNAQQQSGSTDSGGWSGGLDNVPSQAAAPAGDEAGAAAPTDAFGSAGAGGGAALEGAADQGGAAVDAMGSMAGDGAAGGMGAGMGGAAGAAGAAAALDKGGVINPVEEPYREKWRAKNGKHQTPYHADAGGAIPDTADIPVDEDQGQEGQTGDLYSQVKNVLSQTRQQFGLTDNAFQMMNQDIAGNIPTVPGSQSGGGPPRFPLPAGIPGSGGFGTKGALSQNDNDTQSAASGGSIHGPPEGDSPEGYISDIGLPEVNPSYDPSQDIAGSGIDSAVRGKPTTKPISAAEGGAIPEDTSGSHWRGASTAMPPGAETDSEKTSPSAKTGMNYNNPLNRPKLPTDRPVFKGGQ